MPNQCCHIHLICDLNDTVLNPLHDQLHIFLDQKMRLTHDLFVIRPESSAYSWQCINACDCTLLLIGESYGQLANTGVSQLHISYLNARTKNKPMVALIRKTDKTSEVRQLKDFISLIKAHSVEILEYQDDDDLPTLIEQAYAKLQDALNLKESDTVDENASACDIINNKPTPTSKSLDDTPQTPIERIKAEIKAEIKKDILDTKEPQNTAPRVVVPNLSEIFSMACTAHAFQGGTLIDTSFVVQSSWRAILVDLAKISPFSTQGLWKLMNEIATTQAMPAVTINYPEVHAISRCQVVRADILWVQETLLFAGWIERASQDKEIWQLTETAKNLVQS